MTQEGSRIRASAAPGCPPAEQIAEWARAATLAPSMHNASRGGSGYCGKARRSRCAWLVRDPARTGWPQLVLRIGYGLPLPASPRRPVRDVLEEPPPGKYPE